MALILVVDDSQVQKVVIQKYLEELKHQVILAADGHQAHKMAIENQPDLILMDIMMPDCNGFQATRILRKDERTRIIPIVMVSTKNLEIDRYWAEKQGAVGYITKPIVKSNFVETVTSILKSRGKV